MKVFTTEDIVTDLFAGDRDYALYEFLKEDIDSFKELKFSKSFKEFCEENLGLEKHLVALDFASNIISRLKKYKEDCVIPDIDVPPEVDKDYTIYVKSGDKFKKLISYNSKYLKINEREIVEESLSDVIYYSRSEGLFKKFKT